MVRAHETSCKTISCEGTSAPGGAAVALGYATTASGLNSVALGFDTVASGSITTALGSNTTATGDFGTAMGYSTIANCGATEPSEWQACVAMGFNINNTESEALGVSGNVHARNVKLFGADARLAQNVTDASTKALLENVEQIRVVHRRLSKNYCRHQGQTETQCQNQSLTSAGVGLLAQQVETVIPDAVSSGVSLTLAERSGSYKNGGIILESLENMKGLDVHALLAHLIGAVQALSQQNKELVHRVLHLEKLQSKFEGVE